jgi:hypothetical protein
MMFEDLLAGNIKIAVFWVVMLEVHLNANIFGESPG